MLVLRPSPIQGIGVFTTQPFRAGEFLPLWGHDDWRFVSFAEVAADPLLQEACETFCVRQADGWCCPLDFHRMSVGWYMNHSDTPNVHYSRDRNFEYFALRDIAAGEEILCDYAALTSYEQAPGRTDSGAG
jgi:hypothetical protein